MERLNTINAMERLYTINAGNAYLQSYDNKYCSWVYLIDCAMIFSSYSKAYNLMKKINNYYGYTKCKVISHTSKDWACWSKLEANAR